MKIDDFLRRWAFHYVNPDFLKIPMGGENQKVLVIKFQYNEYSLRYGGYGTYVMEKTPSVGDFSGMASQDPIKSCNGYLYKEEKDKNGQITYKVISPFIDKYTLQTKGVYWNFNKDYYYNLDDSNIFAIPAYGTYYFLLKTTFSNNNNYDIDEPAAIYKITITKEFFEQNSYLINNIGDYYYINLFNYFNYWRGSTQLPDYYEPYQVDRYDIKEWYTDSNNNIPYIRDLLCCPTTGQSGNCLAPLSTIIEQEGWDYDVTSHTTQLAISPDDYKYVSNWSTYYESTIQKAKPTVSLWENNLKKDGINTLTHHYTYSKSTDQAFYKKRHLVYTLTDNSTLNIVDETYKQDRYKNEYIITGDKEAGAGYPQRMPYAEITYKRIEGQLVDEQIRIARPSNRDNKFSGWYGIYTSMYEKFLYSAYYSTGSYYRSSGSTSIPVNQGNNTTLYYEDTNIRDIQSAAPWYDYQGTMVFSECVDGDSILIGFWGTGNKQSMIPEIVYPVTKTEFDMTNLALNEIYPNGSGTASRNIFCCLKYTPGSPSGFIYSASNYWYESTNFISLTEMAALQYSYKPDVTPTYQIYVNPATGRANDYTTWTLENTYTRKREYWGGDVPSEPIGWNEIDRTYLRNNYNKLSPELQEHLGVGSQNFVLEALMTTLENDGYNDNIGEYLNEVVAPADVL